MVRCLRCTRSVFNAKVSLPLWFLLFGLVSCVVNEEQKSGARVTENKKAALDSRCPLVRACALGPCSGWP
uniref:Putative secreted protein n=1 Tax=Ixodes ricinus TaxID=34613 RepID=A0A147BKH2_IXORI